MSPQAPQTVSGCLRLSNWRAILTTQADTLSNKRCLLTLVLTPEDPERCLSPGNWVCDNPVDTATKSHNHSSVQRYRYVPPTQPVKSRPRDSIDSPGTSNHLPAGPQFSF
ncbi:hypothetical protein RRG08_007401 [Elysia crispata]|uniref:Uncharacterized protein n=1 Tax=Elysia crispata TaxID=231223 RepID=A0AAE1A3Z2_9GAST|nr:hypothetical protein RRG08_007401 [Elysia crispata]